MPISDAVARAYLEKWGEPIPGYKAPKQPTATEQRRQQEAAVYGRFDNRVETPDDSSFVRAQAGLANFKAGLVQKPLTPSQLLSEEKARRELRFLRGNATPGDSTSVSNERDLRSLRGVAGADKTLGRSVGEADLEFADRIKKDRGLLGKGSGSNAEQLFMQMMSQDGGAGIGLEKGFQEGTPEYDNAMSRIEANRDSTRMIPVAEKLGYNAFSGTPDSFLTMKSEYEDKLRQYDGIRKENGDAAANEWLSNESGGLVDISLLLNTVKAHRRGPE